MFTPALKNLVLVGGGHSHVFVLKSLGMKPLNGLQARLVHDTCVSIDPHNNQIGFRDRPPLKYDCLSIDIGITPDLQSTSGMENVTPVKPIDGFVKRFDNLLGRAKATEGDLKVVVVGGGAGGVELAFALHHRLTQTERSGTLGPKSDSGGGCVHVTLVTGGHILPSHPPRARKLFLELARQRGITVREGSRVSMVEPGAVLSQACALPKSVFPFLLMAIPSLFRSSFPESSLTFSPVYGGLAAWVSSDEWGVILAEGGFLAIDKYLQSAGGPSNVFAAGDVATSVCDPRPKAGVFAVRQGPPLAENLRRYLTGRALKPFKPQKDFLGIITTGGRSAVATRGSIAFSGDWLWTWKDQIDRKFMRKFSEDLPDMNPEFGSPPEILQGSSRALQDVWQQAHMRCKGCAAKVSPNALQQILEELQLLHPESTVSALDGVPLAQDDAAVLPAPAAGTVIVQTVDVLNSPVDDPYTFGRIAAVHALSDCYAMGAQPATALAMVQVKHSAPDVVAGDLRQMMHGSAAELQRAGCALVGGHSSEGTEATLGFSVTGHAQPAALMLKSRLQPGEKLVLTKQLGTGVLLRGAMLRKAHGEDLMAAWQSMLQSNRAACLILQRHGVQACTDVTGFGLLGHCIEMARASKVNVQIMMASVPMLPGVKELLEDGIESTAVTSNSYYLQYVEQGASIVTEIGGNVLLDPQTSGGLLFSIADDMCDAVLSDLRAAQYSAAVVVGVVVAGKYSAASPIQISV